MKMLTPAVLRDHVPFLPPIRNTDKLLHSGEKTRGRLSQTSKIRPQTKGKEPESASQMEDDSKKYSLTKDEVALFRNSHKQSVCVAMLRQGLHRSFSELLGLTHRWNAVRDASERGSDIWEQQPLEEQDHKLDQLQLCLTRAEAAQRAGRYEEVYENQVALACYFVEPEDKWLAHHFYERSLLSAAMVTTDGGRREAEANSNMGHVCTERDGVSVAGQLERAQAHYEAFHHLTEGRGWEDEAGRTLHSRACQCLWRIYTLLADNMLENKDYQPAIQTLTKAFLLAKEGGDKAVEGKAAYRVGLAYQSVGDHETAETYLNLYMDISADLGDDESLGTAYKAVAKSLESEGKLGESVQYLEKFVEVSQDESLKHNLEEACMCLGVFFCSRGQYDRGCQHFQRAYEIAQNLHSVAVLQKAQVYLGTARACMMMSTYSSHVAQARHVHTCRLVAWKESRNDTFAQADGFILLLPSALTSSLKSDSVPAIPPPWFTEEAVLWVMRSYFLSNHLICFFPYPIFYFIYFFTFLYFVLANSNLAVLFLRFMSGFASCSEPSEVLLV
ncbi:tetratricopeptide repeat protein 29 isoform X3 [Anguilla rostrata]|uniref:tetratricopeptide repeat protein 29 isoform X3 n=1 Tax=Anguilla rostrata TaxID=7938 RepID=UPI0030CFE115